MAGYPYQAPLGHRERDVHVSGHETVLCTYEDENGNGNVNGNGNEDGNEDGNPGCFSILERLG